VVFPNGEKRDFDDLGLYAQMTDILERYEALLRLGEIISQIELFLSSH
jgi:hypothetical protein